VVLAVVVKQKDMDYQTILSTLRSRDINDRILMVYMMQDNAIFRDLNREQLKVIAADICALAGMLTKYKFYFDKDTRYKRKSYYSIIQELTAQIIHKLSDK
jgi:hypothetical protein